MTVLLDVHLYGRHVAELVDAGAGEVGVAYTPEALAAGRAARLSLALPVRAEVYPARYGGQRWVRSVLPERDVRDQVALRFAVDPDDDAGLLRHIGRDVAGAAVIVPVGEPPRRPDARARPVTEDEVAERIAGLPENPLGIDPEAGVRLSLAGQQHKLLLTRHEGGWALPLQGEPSTVIVKPEPERYPGLATNELLGLRLARGVDLPTSAASLAAFGPHLALVVERYDRRVAPDGVVTRVHQEDVLGAAGYDPLFKYQHDDEYGSRGPGLHDIAQVLERHLGRAALLRFLGCVTFNLALGNADAHARNYSLLLHEDGSVRLAPLYDLVCTLLYPAVGTELPQRVGPATTFEEVSRSALVAEATGWGLPQELVDKHITRTLALVGRSLERAGREVVDLGGDRDTVTAVSHVVRGQLQRLA